MAIPCSSGGKLSRRMACGTVISTPPESPCSMRQATIAGRLPASPQSIDARVKRAVAAR
jgi:hypothetical protein